MWVRDGQMPDGGWVLYRLGLRVCRQLTANRQAGTPCRRGLTFLLVQKSKQSGLKGKTPDTPRLKMRGESTPKGAEAPLWNPRGGSIHRNVGRFLNLDTSEQRQSPVQPPPRGKGGGTPRLKMRGVYSVDERFLPGLRFFR